MDEVTKLQISYVEMSVGCLALSKMAGLDDSVVDIARLKLNQVLCRLRKQGEASALAGEAECADIHQGYASAQERDFIKSHEWPGTGELV